MLRVRARRVYPLEQSRGSGAGTGRRLLLGEVLLGVGGVDGVGALLPVGGADLTVLVGELEGLDDTDGLLDGAADGEVVDVHGAEGALRVDEEGATEGDALLLEEDTVGLGDRVVAVREEAEVEVGAKAALLAGGLRPGKVGELGVGRESDDLGVDGLELLEGVVEGEDLSGADDLTLADRCHTTKLKDMFVWSRRHNLRSALCLSLFPCFPHTYQQSGAQAASVAEQAKESAKVAGLL